MLKSELLEIIANGENSGVEFKRDDVRPEQLAREVVAMLNLQGGMVLLGVEDDGTLTGTQRADLEEWVMNAIQDKVHPMVLPFYEEVRVDDTTTVAIVSFPRGISKPYVLRHHGREEIYLRVGSTSRLATREQQMRLFAAGGLLHTELMPVPGTDLASLDDARLLNYVRDILADPEVPASPEQWQQRLLGLGFLVEAGNNVCCTIAGLVLFGKAPRRHLRQAGLRVLVFDGADKRYQAELDATLDGPMVGRWDVQPAGRALIEAGLIERLIETLTPFIRQDAEAVSLELRRDVAWHYPVEVLREVLLNALAHRDWTRAVEIEVTRYADRLELISPGALPNTMTVAKMLAGQRSPRNPIIMEVLRDYGYVDHRGMGVRTKIVPLMHRHSGQPPDFEATDDHLRTVLHRRHPAGAGPAPAPDGDREGAE